MTFRIAFLVAILFIVGCASTPAPTFPAPTAIPSAIPKPTQVPTNTTLPPTPTLPPLSAVPTETPPPPTNTPIPTTPAPTATNTRVPVTLQPSATATTTPTQVVVKYGAPIPLEPHSGDTRTTSNDLLLSWQPVAALGADECYLVTVRITNTLDGEYGEQSFLAENTCNDAGDGTVNFVLHKRAPAPDYVGLVAIAAAKNPTTSFRVTWNVLVVKNNGADPNKPDPASYVSISPRSETFEFDLQG